MENFKCILIDQGIALQGGATNLSGESYKFGFVLSYEKEILPWDEAKAWCEKQGGRLPSIEQLRLIAEHRNEINAMLKSAEKEELSGWHWSDKEDWDNPEFAWFVVMNYGLTYSLNKLSTYYVRAVSAFPN